MKYLIFAFFISVAIVSVNCGSKPYNVCGEKPDAGVNCPGGVPTSTYYFNPNSGLCEKLQYNGCGGNGNRFENKYICELTCSKVCGKSGFGCRRPSPGANGRPLPLRPSK